MNKEVYITEIESFTLKDSNDNYIDKGSVKAKITFYDPQNSEEISEFIKPKMYLSNIDLKQENKQLKERIKNQEFLLKSQGKELKELYSIINKAIELIENIPEIPNNYLELKRNTLLEILNGDSNEKYRYAT